MLSINSKLGMWSLKLIGVIIFLVIIFTVDFNQFSSALSSFTFIQILWLEFLSLLIVLTKGLRFHVYLKINNINSRFYDTTLIYAVGIFLSFITPGHVGDFSKVIYIKNLYNVGYKNGVFLNIIDRFFDLFVLILFSLFILDTLFDLRGIIIYSFIILFMISFLFLFVKYSNGIIGWFEKKIKRLLKKDFGDLQTNNEPLKLISIKTLLPLTLSFISNLIIFYQLYFISTSLQIKAEFINLSSILALANIVSMLPITILGLGTRDATFISIMGLQGYTPASAFSLSFSFFLFNNIGVLLIGLLLFLVYKKSLFKNLNKESV